jgi:hypothetical protein
MKNSHGQPVTMINVGFIAPKKREQDGYLGEKQGPKKEAKREKVELHIWKHGTHPLLDNKDDLHPQKTIITQKTITISTWETNRGDPIN